MKNYDYIKFTNTNINQGFWYERQLLNSTTTIYAVWEQFKSSGRFEALKLNWKEGAPNKPHIFWDSDIAKWIESVAFILEQKQDKVLENAADEYIDIIAELQEDCGYFNSYFMRFEPENRWTRRTDHELYCAGHLIEAAVAYYNATGKDKFLKCMCKFADYIEKVFLIDKSSEFLTPGHEEIELALVKLYKCTGEKRYLELSKYFVDQKGKDTYFYDFANAYYTQDHLPVREQTSAEGHAVRAVYLYSAMADLAQLYSDIELKNACEKIFDNTTQKKMYITGGIGSSYIGEAFTIDYDLPNLTAYSESCAAIGLIFFAHRMLTLEPNSKYSDVIERILYNGFLSDISLDGKSFFYENPLEINPKLVSKDVSIKSGRTKYPLTQRQEVFGCSCCPPNITRLTASLGDYLYTYNDRTLYVHQYISSSTSFAAENGDISIEQNTKYPIDGNIKISARSAFITQIALRIPYWCEKYSILVYGEKIDELKIDKGYVYLPLINGRIEIDLILEMDVYLVEANPNVSDNCGRVAVCRGPLVYCLEAIDNGSNLRDIAINFPINATTEIDPLFKYPIVKINGQRRDPNKVSSLYRRFNKSCIDQELKFIPYFGFANRGESEMLVWVTYSDT